jgi:acetyltransferase-like isoleucine patch superfamily enzyme
LKCDSYIVSVPAYLNPQFAAMWNLIDSGNNLPGTGSLGQRLVWLLGTLFARGRSRVSLEGGAKIHPGARICPRDGEIRIGHRSYVADRAVIQGNVGIGKFCSINIGATLLGYGNSGDSEGSIVIGDHVRVAPGVIMVAANHVYDRIDVPIATQGLKRKSIVIGDDVWIAANAIITAGVKVGHGAIVGAGSVVTKDVAPFTIVAGSPARVVRVRAD